MIEWKDTKVVPDIFHEYTEKGCSTPIIIDNGSYKCRIGWALNNKPLLIFKNLMAKPRKERNKKDNEIPSTPPIQIGNDITNIEAVRFQLKTQFDRNIVTHFEAQEQILDYVFSHIGIDTEGSINHPIVMTEAFLNPNYSRNLMSELLFECYGVPSVAYGVDSLLSFYYNQNAHIASDALIISLGYHATHVIPVINHKPIFEHSRRINIGGWHITNFLHRLLQLKYPIHTNTITLSRVEQILQEHCYISANYYEEIKKWANIDFYEKNVKKIQLPFLQSAPYQGPTAEQRLERRRNLARRLIEMNAKKREEKLTEEQQKLFRLTELLQYLDDGYTTDLIDEVADLDVKTYEDVEKAIAAAQLRIEKVQQRKINQKVIINRCPSASSLNEVEDSDKIPIPPAGLEIDEWVDKTKLKRQAILDHRAARKQRRIDMARRGTAAAQERMRIISQLARKEKGNDDFGMRDEDWDVYKTISREGGDSDSEGENEQLIALEDILRRYDPTFDESSSFCRQNCATAESVDFSHHLRLGVEAFRATELLFQPSIIGCIEAGLAETIDHVLKQFNQEEQFKLVQCIFITGGCSRFSGLTERLAMELTQIRPFGSPHRIYMANSADLDAWNGAKLLANDEASFIFRADYEEKGGEFLRTHFASNSYTKSPDEAIPEL